MAEAPATNTKPFEVMPLGIDPAGFLRPLGDPRYLQAFEEPFMLPGRVLRVPPGSWPEDPWVELREAERRGYYVVESMEQSADYWRVSLRPMSAEAKPLRRDLKVTACNYTESTSAIPAGALAYVLDPGAGMGGERQMVLARSRGGRWIRKWESRKRLGNFREKTIPPEHPRYRDLGGR